MKTRCWKVEFFIYDTPEPYETGETGEFMLKADHVKMIQQMDFPEGVTLTGLDVKMIGHIQTRSKKSRKSK